MQKDDAVQTYEQKREEWVSEQFELNGGTVGNVALYEDLCVQFDNLYKKGIIK